MSLVSPLPVNMGSQRVRKHDGISYTNNGTGNGNWRYNNNGIVISEPGCYIITQTTSPYATGGRNYIGMFEIYTNVENGNPGTTKYCKPLGSRAGTYSTLLFDPAVVSRHIASTQESRVLTTASGNFLIGYDDNQQHSNATIIICKFA